MKLYECKSPCGDCPYRKDTELAKWDVNEFIDLMEKESDYFGGVYLCHKKNGSICVGFLMNQDKRNHSSIALRLSLSRHEVTREYLDSLFCKSEMFETVEEMCQANFPEIFGDNNVD